MKQLTAIYGSQLRDHYKPINMKYSASQRLLMLLIAIFFSCASHIEATKMLTYSPVFNDVNAWEDERLPCPGDEVVFPQDYDAVLALPERVDVNGFTLPREGALLLGQNSIISIAGDGDEREHHCAGGGGDTVHLKPPLIHKWYDPHSWRSSKVNGAQPDIERVPCDNDTVILGGNGGVSLAIDMENVRFLRVGELSLAGAAISRSYLQQLITFSDLGSILFKNSDQIAVEFYRSDVCGCHKNLDKFMEPICHNVKSECNRPHCMSPITPFGSCCPVCGAVLRFATDACDDLKLQKLHSLIAATAREQDLSNDIVFHINYINTVNFGNFLQAIIMDRDGYSKRSVEFARTLNESTNWHNFFSNKILNFDVQVAGRPYNPNITFGSIILIVLCLMFVGFVALVIFTHYAPDHPYIQRLPPSWRNLLLRSPFVFARFDNFTNADDRGEHNDNGVRRRDNDIVIRYTECANLRRERAFDNPLFEEAGTSAAAAIAPPPVPISSIGSTEATMKGGTDGDAELEGLTEIKLDTLGSKDTTNENNSKASDEEIEII